MIACEQANKSANVRYCNFFFEVSNRKHAKNTIDAYFLETQNVNKENKQMGAKIINKRLKQIRNIKSSTAYFDNSVEMENSCLILLVMLPGNSSTALNMRFTLSNCLL